MPLGFYFQQTGTAIEVLLFLFTMSKVKFIIILPGLLSFLIISSPAFSQKAITGISSKPLGPWAIQFSPDDKHYAVGGDDSILRIYATTSHKLHKWYKCNSMIKNLRWHPAGKVLAIANMKGVQLLDVPAGKLTEVPGLKTGARGIVWNNNGGLLGLADGFGIVQIMNKEGKIIRSIKKHNNKTYMAIDWHPSKNIIVTGSDEIILFDTSGTQLKLINHRKESTGVLAVTWHPSSDFFVSGDYGHEDEGKPTLLQFWKPDGTLIRTIKGHHSEIRNLSWNAAGTLLATASDALRIYSKDGTLLYTGKTRGYNLWGISWNSKGTLIITSSYDGYIDLWTNKGKLVKRIIE